MAKINEESMIIDGIAAAQTVDSSGEILQVEGCDISSLKEGKGVLNWEHQGANAKDKLDTPRNAIGKIIFAKKIFKLEDADDDRQRFFYKKVNVPMIYIKARLYDGTGHEDAKAAAASFRDAVLHKEAPIINFSIEGHTIEKDGNKIKVSMARAVAATHKPCNKAAIATVFHDPVTGEKHEIEGKKKDDTLASLVEVDKSEVPGKQLLSSVPVDYDPVVEEDPRHLLKMAVDNLREKLEPLKKMALVHRDEAKPMTVYRIMNSSGKGPYHTGMPPYKTPPEDQFSDHKRAEGKRLVDTNRIRPGPAEDFPPEEYGDGERDQWGETKTTGAFDASQHLFGFLKPEHAVAWFGDNGMKALAEQGYHLREVPASEVYHSDSGRQVFFKPHSSFAPSAAKVVQAPNIVKPFEYAHQQVLKQEPQPLEKTLTAGGYGGAPGSLTGGAALQREDLRKKVITKLLKNQILWALRDFDPYVHKDFKKFLKSRLPEVDDAFIDYFAGVANDFQLKKSEEVRIRRLEYLTIELKKNAVATQPATPAAPGAHTPFQMDPAVANGHLHSAPHLKIHEDQHNMIHGLDLHAPQAGQVQIEGVSHTRRVQLPTGDHGLLKAALGPGESPTMAPSSAHAETIFHNAAHGFFGLGAHVPTTAYVQHPTTGEHHSVMKIVPDAAHYDQHNAQHDKALTTHGNAGTLDKLALMDSILGNTDRHGDNYMIGNDGQIHMIDHGHTFDYGDKDLTAPNDNYWNVRIPGYLEDYHRLRVGSTKQADMNTVPLHPEAANWIMGLSPQNLTGFLRGQGLDSKLSMTAGKRLSTIQRAIQNKGFDIGAWEAYNAPYGPNSWLGHKLRGALTPDEEFAAQQEAANAAANAV